MGTCDKIRDKGDRKGFKSKNPQSPIPNPHTNNYFLILSNIINILRKIKYK